MVMSPSNTADRVLAAAAGASPTRRNARSARCESGCKRLHVLDRYPCDWSSTQATAELRAPAPGPEVSRDSSGIAWHAGLEASPPEQAPRCGGIADAFGRIPTNFRPGF